ncbi:DNA primase [Hyphomicrobium sp. DY-1]|uniref:DNA primase n=1 Tax=Hyphomicrobium sp. DY-1 TaxID=3075650 RepID=UPI0039C25BCC
MRFSPNFLDEIRSRLSVSQVVGRKVALKKAGREFRGLSPFKAEKSPSFFVNDQKGFYHCFASGEHGDIFTFVMKTEGLEFPEAVERLAAEAGVPMPKQPERNIEQEDQRERLYRLLEASAEFFETSLRAGPGSEARRYLEKRGLAAETIQSFRLGFAPNSRTALSAFLKGKGFSAADMATAGMLIAGADIPEPYDRFRNRVMFPILDLKGRVIAFGGRALDKDAPAKYLNSPETPLFHKGHILFNAARARSAGHDKNRVIVVEGYMDVVTLSEAGFGESVAPLGTALTEDQLKLLWRIAPEPILCFDGDSAGQKAANRAVEVALPWVKPGHSVAFAFLPNGLDPDDLIRQQGAAAMSEVLEKTRPLIDVLWERELNAQPTTTPEQRAALEARLGALTNSIQDAAVRNHYARELRDRLYQLGRQRSPMRGGAVSAGRFDGGKGQGSYARPVAAPDWRQRDRTRLGGASSERRFASRRDAVSTLPLASPELTSHFQSISPREALIMKTLLNHPWLIDEYSEAIAAIEFAAPALSVLRDEILGVHARQNSLDSATLRTQLSKSGVAKVVDLVAQTITHASDRFAEPDASAADVEAAWHHILALHQRQAALGVALKAAEEAWYRDCTEEAEMRLLDIKRQIAREAAMDQMDEEFEQPDDDASEVKRAV